MATEEQIADVQELYRLAVLADLDGVEFIAGFPDEELADSYNGIGPEFLPPKVRAKVTKSLALFEPAALVHDLRNEYSDGTRCSFNYANYEFRSNCRKLADARYAWWNPRRYVVRYVAELLYRFVAGDCGWTAWLQAKERHERKVSGNSAGENKE